LALSACSSGRSKTATTPSTTASESTTTSASGTVTAGSWPTYHHDGARSGVADDQQPLGQVRKAWSSPGLDGSVYTQPLVADGRVIAATEADTVYALDAATGQIGWRAKLGTPVNGGSLPCGNIDPSGITGTPVVDPATNTVYV